LLFQNDRNINSLEIKCLSGKSDRLLEEGFTKVDVSTCVKVIRKIKEREDQFWNEDMNFDPSE
jgi:hypothetical protein